MVSINTLRDCADNMYQYLQHEDWSADVRGSPSDLALLELSEPVEFNDYIQPACLPAYTNEEFTPHDQCWISGWGDTKGKCKPSKLNSVLISLLEQQSS